MGDFISQQLQRIMRERAEMEAKGETPPPLPDFLDPDKMMDDATDWVKDQFTTKEEKEAKSRKKREEIEERERKEREAAGPSLADMFSGFKFGSGAPVKMAQPAYYKEHRKIVGLLNKTGKALLKEAKDQQGEATATARKLGARNPFYHLRGAAKDNELNMRKEGDDPRNWGYDEEEEVEAPPPEQPKFVFGDNFDPEKFLKPQPYDPNNPMMFMVGNGFGPDGEFIPPTIEDIKKHYDKPNQPPPVFDDEPEEMMMQRYYYSQKAPGKYRQDNKRGGSNLLARTLFPTMSMLYDTATGKNILTGEGKKEGGMINPFDKDGNLLPQFQRDPMVDDSMFQKPFVPEFDWIENERRTTNPFYHLQGAGPLDDFIASVGQHPATTDLLNKGANYVAKKLADKAFDYLMGGVAHNPKGHTTRNNNLTKQKPQKKKFCGFVAKKFAHEDYDPAKMHKFRAATCGGKPLPIGGRPEGAKNKQGYVKSGEFTEGRKRYGQSKQFRIMGEGRQMRVMPDEDELVSKKENPIVDKIIHEPMDDGDIRSYFPKARVMRYADLADYDDIEQVLPEAKSHVFLLYQHRPNDGHFVCIMRYGNTIEFFCSYGSKIDGPLYWTSLPEREALGEGKPWLSMLLKKASKRFKAIHNPVAFQSKKDGVATCGAYCVMRINQLLNHNQDLHEFIDYMKELKEDTGLSYDEIAANYVNKR
jgi:hypothetical protein